MTNTLTLAGAKGGVGTSTAAAVLAANLARAGATVDLVPTDRTGDLAAIYGAAGAADPERVTELLPGLHLIGEDCGPAATRPDADWRIIDAGTIDTVTRGDALPLVIVAREDYLNLRRMTTNPVTKTAAGILLVQEPGRALGASDVANVTDLPIVARVPYRTAVARAVDAGVIGAHAPECYAPAVNALADLAQGADAR